MTSEQNKGPPEMPDEVMVNRNIHGGLYIHYGPPIGSDKLTRYTRADRTLSGTGDAEKAGLFTYSPHALFTTFWEESGKYWHGFESGSDQERSAKEMQKHAFYAGMATNDDQSHRPAPAQGAALTPDRQMVLDDALAALNRLSKGYPYGVPGAAYSKDVDCEAIQAALQTQGGNDA
jgi:hypothetical protein